MRDDTRYRSVKREDREAFFNEYISELKAAEAEVELAAKAKLEEQVCSPQFFFCNFDRIHCDYLKMIGFSAADSYFVGLLLSLRVQEKLKKREEEMRKKKQREEQEMEAVRLRVRRKEAESSYQALLVEKIKDAKVCYFLINLHGFMPFLSYPFIRGGMP